jgi:dTDP-4-dehydrorhamnose reductase
VPKRILIIGSNGLLGHKLSVYYKNSSDDVLAVARQKNVQHPSQLKFIACDLLDSSKMLRILEDFMPTHVINAAAYTAVDMAEIHQDEADRINHLHVAQLSKFCLKNKAHLLHISTDYVFDGLAGPYSEKSDTNPLSVYGQSKLNGDSAILIEPSLQATIFRASVVFGAHKNQEKLNFVTWLIQELLEYRSVRIVDDQFGNFTYVEDLVTAIDLAIQKNIYGLFHLASQEMMTRYEFSCLIADILGLNKTLIKPVKTAEFKQLAKRPLRSGLIVDKFIKTFKIEPTPLKISINAIYTQLTEK